MARETVQFQHPGQREEQQDAIRLLTDPASGVVFALVADGAGGHSGGRLASETVARLGEAAFQAVRHPVADPGTFLRDLARRSHEAVREAGAAKGLAPRTTVAALYLAGRQAHGMHSGDSRIYHFRDREIHRRTEDHSVAQMLVVRGMITEAEMGSHPDQGKLTQCLGGEHHAEPELFTRTVEPSDTFLLCSDGVWEHFSPAEMMRIQEFVLRGGKAAAAKVAEGCLDRGGKKADNLSLISIGAIGEGKPVGRARKLLVPILLLLFGWITGLLLSRL